MGPLEEGLPLGAVPILPRDRPQKVGLPPLHASAPEHRDLACGQRGFDVQVALRRYGNGRSGNQHDRGQGPGDRRGHRGREHATGEVQRARPGIRIDARPGEPSQANYASIIARLKS